MASRIFTIIVLLCLSSCEKSPLEGSIQNDEKLIKELYDNSVDTLQCGTHRYKLTAYLWRDFMPMSPPNGKPLISINWLLSIDSVAIPKNLDLTEQYVIYDAQVWISKYTDEKQISSPLEIQKISRNGPKWGPGVNVDVVSKIHDSTDEKDYFLIIKDVPINRTD